MALTVDLNADMGEAFGDWTMGDDLALLELVSSANVACGFHAGDPDVMARTMAAAQVRGVGIGAHPGFPDLQGFGRRAMAVPSATLANMVRYQIGAAQAMAQVAGTSVRHVKLHGALANMAASDENLALTCFKAALSVSPDLIIMAMAATKQQTAVEKLGCRAALEIFADRAYNPDGTLVSRGQPGAVLHDAEEIADRVLHMVREGAIITVGGDRIATRIDTICLHGDTPSAVQAAQRVRAVLEGNGIEISAFAGAACGQGH